MTAADYGLRFDNTYRRLPEHFYASLPPSPVAAPRLIVLNKSLSRTLGLDVSSPEKLTEVFAGNQIPRGAEPISLAYAGHQFGNFVPQLGDGRACLLGEVLDSGGQRFDITLKGSGPTPFSRGGDGRAALGPVLREYILSEAMHALGIPTTRALAAVSTGETVLRETALPGAIVVRVAASHIRVGTFQYFAAREDTNALRLLADHVIQRHYPQAAGRSEPYLELLERVVMSQAQLISHWMRVGFIHGVMNTDNMTLSGETIDYGPCAFMDSYDTGTVFSSIDVAGRYAYANQARIAQWNLARLAETLLPLICARPEDAVDPATRVLEGFPLKFEEHWTQALHEKLGLVARRDGDAELAQTLLDAMQTSKADFTQTFRRLCDCVENPHNDVLADVFGSADLAAGWGVRWRTRLQMEGDPAGIIPRMRAVNPATIPRNHLVEQAIQAAVETHDFSFFHALNKALEQPFVEPDGAAFTTPPLPHECVQQTFCGT